MGSFSSKMRSKYSKINLIKNVFENSSERKGTIRKFPRQSNIGYKSENHPNPSSLSPFSLPSIESEANKSRALLNGGRNGLDTSKLSSSLSDDNTNQIHNADDLVMNTSLSKRLQKLGPVQRQDNLANNYTIPSLSGIISDAMKDEVDNKSLLSSNTFQVSDRSPAESPVFPQVVPNPSNSNTTTVTLPSSSLQEHSVTTHNSGHELSFDHMTSRNSTIANAAITILKARQICAQEAEAEFANLGKGGFDHRRYLDIDTVRQIIVMRDTESGLQNQEIERRLGLGVGVVKLLGRKGVVGLI